ncbi:hypothetical protein Rhal01_03526 [Rubritalea halochordaticola]|uniref:Ice-binding protein C-terminal domain-containing protein n=1 Tax=Rubritalea halochordaticola TaxID=714537 RepID=A0ABP9V3U8_9BACT
MRNIPLYLPVWMAMAPLVAQAATVSWGSAYNFNHTDESLWLNSFDSSRNGGTSAAGAESLISAISYGNAAGDPVINGMAFTELSGSTDFWGNTGINPNIDSVLSGHRASAGTFDLNLTGLTVGNTYQIQLIGIHDNRATIKERQYEVSFGGTDYTSGGTPAVLTRAGYGNTNPASPPNYQGFDSYGTVVGTFIADADTQLIQLRSNTLDGVSGDDNDPGLSGYILIESAAIPEPSSMALLGLGGLVTLLRRRR